MDTSLLSLATTILGSLCVFVVSIYGFVQCVRREGNLLVGFFFFALSPIWLAGHYAAVLMFDGLDHFHNVATPILNTLAVLLIYFVVIGYVRSLRDGSWEFAPGMGLLRAVTGAPRRLVGLVVIVGAAAVMPYFIVAGVLLVIVGVSLIFDVRLWGRR